MDKKLVLLHLAMVAVALYAAGFVLSLLTPKLAQPAARLEVRIAAATTPEQRILAELLSLTIENNSDMKAPVLRTSGGADNIHAALAAGEFQLYPESTDTAWRRVLLQKTPFDVKTSPESLRRGYAERFALQWRLFHAGHTFGTVTSDAFAEKHPALLLILYRLNGIPGREDLERLKRQVAVEKRDARQVAREYLKALGLML